MLFISLVFLNSHVTKHLILLHLPTILRCAFKSNDADIWCLLMSLVCPPSLHVYLIFWIIVIKRLSLFYLFMLEFLWEHFWLVDNVLPFMLFNKMTSRCHQNTTVETIGWCHHKSTEPFWSLYFNFFTFLCGVLKNI